MTSACCKSGGRPDGLISGHAYSLLDIAELKDSNGKVVHTLAKMRNPWNSEHYKGAFNDKDGIWDKHPEWKKQVNL